MGLFNITWSLQAEKLIPPLVRDRYFEQSTLFFTNELGQNASTPEFKTGPSNNQTIEYVLMSSAGHWKEFPTIGVNIYRYLQGTTSPQNIVRAIKQQLLAEGFNNPTVKVDTWPKIIVNDLMIELVK